MLLSIPLKYSVLSFMGYLKGKSAMMIFEKHGNLKCKFSSMVEAAWVQNPSGRINVETGRKS